MESPIQHEVLGRFLPHVQPDQVISLGGAGGLSGAQLWRVHTDSKTWCLRCWPTEHPTPIHLSWIHEQMIRAANSGCNFVPHLQRTRSGDTFVSAGGHLWELATWLPGEADYHAAPSHGKLTSALGGLASVHVAWQPSSHELAGTPGPAPGIVARNELAERWHDAEILALSRRIPTTSGSDEGARVALLCREIVAAIPSYLPECRRLLAEASKLSVVAQPCLRDVWHDHVLFRDDQLSGMIDFGAMRYDSPAADLARLLGSLVGDELQGWQSGLDAYAEIRPLTENELRLIRAYDRANCLFSGLNWVQWLYVEGRSFPLDRVIERLTAIRSRVVRPAVTA